MYDKEMVLHHKIYILLPKVVNETIANSPATNYTDERRTMDYALWLPNFQFGSTSPISGNVRQTIEIPFKLWMPLDSTMRTTVF